MTRFAGLAAILALTFVALRGTDGQHSPAILQRAARAPDAAGLVSKPARNYLSTSRANGRAERVRCWLSVAVQCLDHPEVPADAQVKGVFEELTRVGPSRR
jgi:hypothetical protein